MTFFSPLSLQLSASSIAAANGVVRFGRGDDALGPGEHHRGLEEVFWG